MSNNYATAAQLASWLDLGTQTNDDLIGAALNAASRQVEMYCGQHFYNETATRTFTPECSSSLDFPPIATTSGMVVNVDTGLNGGYATTWTLGTQYLLKPDSGYDSMGFATPYDSLVVLPGYYLPMWAGRPTVQITATWGWTAVPDEIRQATLLLASRIYRRRLTPEGFAAGEAFGAIRVSNRMDPDAEAILQPYRTVRAMVA